MQPLAESTRVHSHRSATKSGPSVKWFLLFWILMIALGVYAVYSYAGHLKDQVLSELGAQSQQQLTIVKTDYESKIAVLSEQVKELQSTVETFNELLTFTKDNASSKTDSSNKLYTQLSEVKKQLDALKKEMDLLK
jgi:sensor domain CHASE-containing protein